MFNPSGAQFAWDSSSLKLYEACPRKYQYKILARWQPARKSVHLLFGGWYATALEDFHKAVADGVDRNQALLDVVHEAMIATWEYPTCPGCDGEGSHQPEGNPLITPCDECDGTGQARSGGTPWLSDHNAKTRENLIRTIIWYFDQFEDDSCQTVILSDGSPAVEHSFKLPVDNDVILCGHLDRVVDYGGKIYIQDQKTSGSTITARFFDQWNPETQMSLYTFAGRAIFNLPVKGVMIDAAQIAVGFSRFERGFTFRDDAQLSEWYDGAMHTIESAQRATVENYFPQNSASCGNYGGCEFRNVCSKSPHVREQFLKADFVKGEQWNPLIPR